MVFISVAATYKTGCVHRSLSKGIMLSLLTVILPAFTAGFLTVSYGTPCGFYLVVQIIMAVIGYGSLTLYEAHVYYALVFIMFVVVSMAMARTFNLIGVAHRMLVNSTTPEPFVYLFVRCLKAVFIVALKFAAAIPFEYIPHRWWFGGGITLVILAIANILLYFMFRRYCKAGRDAMPPPDWNMFFYDRCFTNTVHLDQNLLLQSVICIGVFDVMATLIFWPMYYQDVLDCTRHFWPDSLWARWSGCSNLRTRRF